jgi:hypothetical protein
MRYLDTGNVDGTIRLHARVAVVTLAALSLKFAQMNVKYELVFNMNPTEKSTPGNLSESSC